MTTNRAFHWLVRMNGRNVRLFLRMTFCLTALTLQTIGTSATAQPSKIFPHAVVAADHAAASAAGAEMLRRGGNVVDAAVATSFALAVVRPASCGLGGGGFMVIWDADKQAAVTIDYRERAPAAATRTMYVPPEPPAALSPESTLPPPREAGSVCGASAAGIPGTVAGLCLIAEQYGTLPLSELLQPAIELCDAGVLIDEHDIDVQASTLRKLSQFPDYQTRFSLLKKLYLNDGVAWRTGDRFHSPLKPILQLIAQHGADGFYRGPVATAIIDLMNADGGFLTHADLQSTIPAVRTPLQGTFRGRTVVSMPPPSSGGVALLQTLNTLQEWEQLSGKQLKTLAQNSEPYVHVVTEAMKHAFADRAEFLGDTDYASVPVQRMLSREYARKQAEQIELSRTLSPENYGRFFSEPDAGTSHFSVIDAAGNAVACTETINLTFGSFAVVPEFGVILNNQMDDFAANPGQPNAFGLMQSEANAIQPGKKPLSSMTPTIVVQEGKARLACGASGGPRIITATLQTLLNSQVFDQSPAEAVTTARFHHQWFPDELLLERHLSGTVAAGLRHLGHDVKSVSGLAAAQAADRVDGGVRGGSDPRKLGQPAGF